MKWLCLSILSILLFVFLSGWTVGEERLKVASTTSTANTGLLKYLHSLFEKKTGIRVDTIAVGTGKALKLGKNGDVDVVLVHARSAEDAFVESGYGVNRRDVMYNDFIIVGPAKDPAGIQGVQDAIRALQQIASSKSLWFSRGDDSGTHKKEMALWTALGLEPDRTGALWYREAGAGMGATLNIAVEMRAYTLTDRGTWISFLNKNDFEVLVADDPELFNQYGVIPVDPKKHPSVRNKRAEIFVQWITGPVGQKWIEEYRIDGRQLFFPNAAEG